MLDRFSNNAQIPHFIQIRQWEPSCTLRTDGQLDTTKLTVIFRNFANEPKKTLCK
jgi:hypothetical protein